MVMSVSFAAHVFYLNIVPLSVVVTMGYSVVCDDNLIVPSLCASYICIPRSIPYSIVLHCMVFPVHW